MNLEPDPVRRRLSAAVAARLATVHLGDAVHSSAARSESGAGTSAWAAMDEMGVALFDAPVTAGGLDLGLAASITVAEELGRAGLAAPYLAVAFAIDAAAAGEAELLPALASGGITVLAAGFESIGFESALRAAPVGGLGWTLAGSVPAEPTSADAVLLQIRLD